MKKKYRAKIQIKIKRKTALRFMFFRDTKREKMMPNDNIDIKLSRQYFLIRPILDPKFRNQFMQVNCHFN
uniref:Uncharacterized protein n=1 Tax=Rhizophora mucronata TaxID=61149 RepID=A0A2P2R411_RHIMU